MFSAIRSRFTPPVTYDTRHSRRRRWRRRLPVPVPTGRNLNLPGWNRTLYGAYPVCFRCGVRKRASLVLYLMRVACPLGAGLAVLLALGSFASAAAGCTY
ncbi:hypothetical protein CBL_13650 [Carabus blaptoides fortunei]